MHSHLKKTLNITKSTCFLRGSLSYKTWAHVKIIPGSEFTINPVPHELPLQILTIDFSAVTESENNQNFFCFNYNLFLEFQINFSTFLKESLMRCFRY